ncbi:vitamin K epoxide reductase family protein [Leucobacter luti]|uniref:Putative membrane protein n=1 Tax=Leucobacter luti TaxID=340320 RepID=A0A4R6S086_9MICO|nr:vitamin K epoxide reductase family protein [Leucobacter luti]MCW2287632.1 putative membrane protein [Leucobacter luti]QYM76347.1 vitamin K epoxide reductase family protein [Leucobacter luti]TCK46202.1 putative membrane protein [Leucobacter luti]TDP92633.1 putative membrane protein [Leucobacter luti]
MSTEPRVASRPVGFAIFTIIAGAIGLFASWELLTEYIKTLQQPGYVPNCAVSILVTCGPNMGSWQGSVFGFSNTIIGVAAFMAPIFVGVALLAGATFAPWFWRVYQLGLLGGFVFICWLFTQSVFSLGTLCPWCMVVWSVMIPLWWFTAFRPYAVGDIPVSERARSVFTQLSSWTWVIVLLVVLVLAFIAQIQLDWLAEFSRA